MRTPNGALATDTTDLDLATLGVGSAIKSGVKSAVETVGSLAERRAAQVEAEAIIAKAKVSDNFYRDGSAVDFGASRVITNPDEAIFWSGRTDGIGGIDAAKSIADQYKGRTLEQLIESRKITMPMYDPNVPSSVLAWQSISTELAKNASGEVRAVLGSQIRPKSIWETYELPELMRNPAVSRIITVDPKTGAEQVVFQRVVK